MRSYCQSATLRMAALTSAERSAGDRSVASGPGSAGASPMVFSRSVTVMMRFFAGVLCAWMVMVKLSAAARARRVKDDMRIG